MKNKQIDHISSTEKVLPKTSLSFVQMQNKLSTCRNSKLQYTRRRSSGDYIQRLYLFYGLYPIKQMFYLQEFHNCQRHLTVEVR